MVIILNNVEKRMLFAAFFWSPLNISARFKLKVADGIPDRIIKTIFINGSIGIGIRIAHEKIGNIISLITEDTYTLQFVKTSFIGTRAKRIPKIIILSGAGESAK